MTTTALPTAPSLAVRARLVEDARDLARVLLVGAALGVVTLGVVGRLIMFLLARANPFAAGMLTDDGFVIDQFTVSGSFQLAATGAVFGTLSGVLHVALAPLKTGPTWFQRLSFSVGAGVVVASNIIHSDGVDFVVLDRPTAAAVGLFLALPVLHVLALDLAVERVRRSRALTAPGWQVAGGLLAVPMTPLLVPLAVGRAGYLGLRARDPGARWLHSPLWAWAVRLGLTVVFVLAATGIIEDVRALA
jgi:hypothetical protein